MICKLISLGLLDKSDKTSHLALCEILMDIYAVPLHKRETEQESILNLQYHLSDIEMLPYKIG